MWATVQQGIMSSALCAAVAAAPTLASSKDDRRVVQNDTSASDSVVGSLTHEILIP
jgi:hypothetical protein